MVVSPFVGDCSCVSGARWGVCLELDSCASKEQWFTVEEFVQDGVGCVAANLVV